MKIYLHIGYHKTGSSFLQMMLSSNREFLKASGIHYPLGDRDDDAKRGKISPGNGLQLSEALATQNKKQFLEIFMSWINEATEKNCDTLLISNEGLFHTLSSKEYQDFFQELKNVAEVSEIQGLLFLRDPLDHIFSLYKHRGKRGTIPDFKNWVEKEYETLQLTEQFLNLLEKDLHINFSLRKYKNDSQYLSDAVFKDWLGIPTPAIPKSDRVNASLSLSEILVLVNIHKLLGREKAVSLQKKLLQNSTPKPKEDNLKKHYGFQIEPFLKKNLPLIERINQEMPANENLIIESLYPPQTDLEFATLTNEQLNIIITECSLKSSIKDKVVGKVKSVYRNLKL